MKLFRNFRFKKLGANNFKKYALYAIGEIFLIVIGVLIAINVNNSNEDRKKEKQLNSIIQVVTTNLENDITNLDIMISEYKTLESEILEITNGKYPLSHLDTINASNYKNCISCFANHISFNPFYPKLDGYEQLKLMNLDLNTNKYKISQDILSFYHQNLRDLNLVEQSILGETLNNLRSIEKYDWYSDYMLGNYNPQSLQYFHSDKMYLNKLMTHKVLIIDNYLNMLITFRKEAKVLSKKLND